MYALNIGEKSKLFFSEYALPQIRSEYEAPTAILSGSFSPFDCKSIFENEQKWKACVFMTAN